MLTRITTHRLEGACTRGKHAPGFPWAIPRYDVAGFDIGLVPWTAWRHRVKPAGEAVLGPVCDVNTVQLLNSCGFQTSTRSQLHVYAGMDGCNVKLCTSYSARKAGAILRETRQATDVEMCHPHGWSESHIPSRYAGSKH